MEGFSANVSFRPSWNNLIDLPSNLTSLLYNANVSPQEVVIELVLQFQNKSYAGWSGMSSKGAKSLAIDPIFAHSLKLADEQAITVNLKIRNIKTSTIFLEPERASDWELVELHASYIESKLIEQSRCVALNQVLVVYPTKTSSVKLLVKDIGTTERPYALIDSFAEISIAPKIREKKKSRAASVKSSKSAKSVRSDAALGPTILKRGICLPHDLFVKDSGTYENYGYEVYARLDEFAHIFARVKYVFVSIVPGPNSTQTNTDIESPSTDDLAKEKGTAITENKHVVAKLVCNNYGPSNTVGLSTKLGLSLNVNGLVGFKVILKPAGKCPSRKPNALVVHPYTTQTKKGEPLKFKTQTRKDQQTKAQQEISDHLFNPKCPITNSPITNFTRIPPIPGILSAGGILTIKRKSDPLAWVEPYDISNGRPNIEIGDEILRPLSFVEDATDNQELQPIYGMEQTVEEIVDHYTNFKNSGILVYGAAGSGKTLMLNSISKRISARCGMFVKYICCETIMNESFDQLSSRVTRWIQEAVWNEPSLLVLDNLDKILPAESENADSTASNQLAEYLVSSFSKVNSQKNTNLSLLVSGTAKESFNKLLSLSHLIEDYYHLSPPGKAARKIILEECLIKKLSCHLKFDIMDIVLECEGYLPNDLKILSDRIFYECIFESQGSNSVNKSHFEKALSGFQPSSLRGVKLQKSTTSWADIGGLAEAKRVLLETLEWPTKYAPIFANCPLRLRSGILLYGYPGCGKTLLASAIAGQCGLNFISIKGPEILNKYIGASEQSVRELFERAQAAKPCILFFDEFDSIAPKRGHDSTGVTDRVVNQLLTQMDGAEGLDGVYVLAATSRPDLIDSALLRPGRLDKSIICDMPSEEDRLNILECVTATMSLTDDVDLSIVAKNTTGFSGADIQGLGYNAYLKAVHETLLEQNLKDVEKTETLKRAFDFFQINSDQLKNKKLGPTEKIKLLQKIEQIFELQDGADGHASTKKPPQKLIIRQKHFLTSLQETKPSISASERAKLDRVYDQFLTGRDGNMPDGAASNEIGGRMTLM